MYFTDYIYFTDAAHPVTSTISCDFHEITRLSASRFFFSFYSDTSIFSRFDFIFVGCRPGRGIKWKLAGPRNVVTYNTSGNASCGELALIAARPPTMKTPNGLGDANKVIITKDDRFLAGRHKKPLLEVALLIYSQESFALIALITRG